MTKSPPLVPGATLMAPSPPMPKRRSHNARVISAVRSSRSSGSASMTKSFPMPWYFENLMPLRYRPLAAVEGVQVLDHGLAGAVEPLDAGVGSEPGALAASEALRGLRDLSV